MNFILALVLQSWLKWSEPYRVWTRLILVESLSVSTHGRLLYEGKSLGVFGVELSLIPMREPKGEQWEGQSLIACRIGNNYCPLSVNPLGYHLHLKAHKVYLLIHLESQHFDLYTIAWKVSSTCTADLLSSLGKYHHLVQSICVHRHLLVVYLSTSASTCTFDLQTLAGKYHLLAQSICRHRLGSKYNILLSYFTLTFYFGLCRMAQAESIKQGVSIAN